MVQRKHAVRIARFSVPHAGAVYMPCDGSMPVVSARDGTAAAGPRLILVPGCCSRNIQEIWE